MPQHLHRLRCIAYSDNGVADQWTQIIYDGVDVEW